MNCNRGIIVALLLLAMISLFAEEPTHTMESRRDLRSANMYFGQRNFEKAYDFYNKVLEVDPDFLSVFELSELSNYTFLVYDVEGDYKKSYRLAGQVVDRCQGILDEYERLQETDKKEAKKFYKANIRKQNIEDVLDNNQKIQQSSWARLLKSAQKLKNEGEYEAAITSFNELYELTPDSTVVVKLLAITHKENEQPDKASEYFQKIIEIDPNDVVAINQLASHHFSNEEYEEAAHWYEKAAKIDTDNENHYFNAAICYSNAENKEKAFEMFKKSAEVNPQYLDALINAGIMAQNLGKTDEQLDFLKQAIAVDSTDKNLVIQLTYALMAQKDFEGVHKYALIWKELDPESEDAQNMIQYAEQQMKQK